MNSKLEDNKISVYNNIEVNYNRNYFSNVDGNLVIASKGSVNEFINVAIWHKTVVLEGGIINKLSYYYHSQNPWDDTDDACKFIFCYIKCQVIRDGKVIHTNKYFVDPDTAQREDESIDLSGTKSPLDILLMIKSDIKLPQKLLLEDITIDDVSWKKKLHARWSNFINYRESVGIENVRILTPPTAWRYPILYTANIWMRGLNLFPATLKRLNEVPNTLTFEIDTSQNELDDCIATMEHMLSSPILNTTRSEALLCTPIATAIYNDELWYPGDVDDDDE